VTTPSRPLPDHGTLSRYKYRGCRCDECRDNYTAYQRTRYRKQAYGTWQPLLDATPVREHLIKLHNAGLSYQVIAESLGRHTPSITSFIYDQGPKRRRRKRVTPELAAAILALKPGDVPPGMIDATGTVRRIEALVAIGWPMRTLSTHVGVASPTINRIRGQKWVFRPTADGVARTYDALRDQKPEDHGVLPGSALKARNLAARNDWRDPLWWEDMGGIDDPNFDPDAAEHAMSEYEAKKLRRQEIIHLARYGCSPEEIHARVSGDLTLRYVKDLVAEVRAGRFRDRSTKQAAA
jgi:hypothetical protein